jgi:hemoglobin
MMPDMNLRPAPARSTSPGARGSIALKLHGMLLFVAALAAGNAVAQGDEALFHALGDKPGITALMSDFVGRLKRDARLGSFFKDTKATYLAQQLTDQVCQLSGGPRVLDEPDMKKAHEGMRIGVAEFNVLVEVLQETMDDHGLPFGTQNRLLSRLAPMHREIVNVR